MIGEWVLFGVVIAIALVTIGTGLMLVKTIMDIWKGKYDDENI